MNIGIKIKNISVLRGMFEENYDPILIDIVCYVADKYGIVLTESFREKLHANDLHGTDPVRALDLREWCYHLGVAKEIEADINSKWQYDLSRPEKKCAWIHKNRKTNGIHFHIQVHPNTVRI